MGYHQLDEALPMPANRPLPFPRHQDSKVLPLHLAVGFLPPNTEGYLWGERAHLLDIGQKFQPKASHQNRGWCSSLGKGHAKSLSCGASRHNGRLQGWGKIGDKRVRLSSLCRAFYTIPNFSMNMLIGRLAATRIPYRAGVSYTAGATSHLLPFSSLPR